VASASVLIVGGGLAGLAAAYHLQRRGCRATIIEARDRIGGRVWTLRDGFGGMHAEAGGDLIDDDQEEIRKLLDEFRLEQTRILRQGFFHYRRGRTAQRRLRASSPGWRLTAQALDPLIQLYKLNGEEWQGPIATAIGSQSIAEWLRHSGKAHLERISRKAAADGAEIAATAVCMRNFFLGDPDELSLLTYVEQFAAGNDSAKRTMYRIHGGNDRLPERIASALRAPVLLRQICRRIVQKKHSVQLAVENARARRSTLSAEYCIVAVPAPLAAEIEYAPSLPERQHDAFARLRYGRATKTLLQFDRHPWRRSGRPRACATDLGIGAVWDGSEDQRDDRGILTLLAGGSASDATKALLAAEGARGLADRVSFFGTGAARLIASQSVSWEDDPWARGGYALFDPRFPPAERQILALPYKRVFFAGEHTSKKWQGYMNGAVESGLRAAEEVLLSFAN
jgi:monoamine oxidase